MNAYKLGADIGDAIAGMAVIKSLGGGHVRLYSTPGTKGFNEARYNALLPLVQRQDYVTSVCRYDENEDLKITHDFSDFRTHWGSHPTLIGKQAVCVGVDPASVSLEPWMKIDSVPRHGKIIICQSMRHKGAFHWFRLFQTKPQDCIFLGVEEDYRTFCIDNSPWRPCKKAPSTIEFRPTENLLEAAKLIMGARLCIFNQTALLWVAYALGFAPLMVEQLGNDSYLPREGRRYISRPEENPTLKEFEKL